MTSAETPLLTSIFVGQCEAVDVEPWTNTHLQMRKFSDRLKDLEELVFLYPNIDKRAAFGPYYTNDGKLSNISPRRFRARSIDRIPE